MENKRTHVFIVDDSPWIRARLVEMLGRIDGIRIAGEAATAADAISGIQRTHPHIVLLDLNLGSQTGFGVLRAIGAQAPRVEFIVITNHSEPQYRAACAKAGVRFFLDKTTDFDLIPLLIAGVTVH